MARQQGAMERARSSASLPLSTLAAHAAQAQHCCAHASRAGRRAAAVRGMHAASRGRSTGAVEDAAQQVAAAAASASLAHAGGPAAQAH
jgi:hypothetical protein